MIYIKTDTHIYIHFFTTLLSFWLKFLKIFSKTQLFNYTYLIFGIAYLQNWSNSFKDTFTIGELSLHWHYCPIAQPYLFCSVLGKNTAYSAGKHYTGLCGKRKVYAKHAPVFHNYSSCLSKGQTVQRRCRSNALFSNWHLTLYFCNYALSIWYIFIWHVHKKIRRHFCELPIFCCLETFWERRLKQT